MNRWEENPDEARYDLGMTESVVLALAIPLLILLAQLLGLTTT
jgi:hypothetical protein